MLFLRLTGWEIFGIVWCERRKQVLRNFLCWRELRDWVRIVLCVWRTEDRRQKTEFGLTGREISDMVLFENWVSVLGIEVY